MTAATLVSAKSLRAECERIARAGYSCDRQEFIAGLIALAVPVRDRSGAVRAAVAVHAPAARMPLRRAMTQLGPLREAAREMELLL
jgi:IclR family transcriptional regulator, acetate operon repressor